MSELLSRCVCVSIGSCGRAPRLLVFQHITVMSHLIPFFDIPLSSLIRMFCGNNIDTLSITSLYRDSIKCTFC